LRQGGGGKEARLNSPQRKSGKGGAQAPLTVEGFTTTEVAVQRRWRARAGAQRSDGDVVGFRHGRWRSRKWLVGTAFNPPGAFGHRRPRQPIRAQREETLPLTARPHSSAFSVLKITPG
jgi:hypothetical protein